MLTRSVQAQPLIPMATSLAYGVLFASAATLLVAPAFLLVLRDLTGGAKRVGDLLGDLAGTAPRLARWMERFPYVQESLRAREFEDLQIPRRHWGWTPRLHGLPDKAWVRLYYEREFDREEMRAQLGAIAAKAPATDSLVGEVRIWAEQQSFQLGVHMLRGVIAPPDAARPLTNILDSCLGELLGAAKRDLLADLDQPLGGSACLVALGSAGRREFAIGSPLRLLFVYEPASGRTSGPSLAPRRGVWAVSATLDAPGAPTLAGGDALRSGSALRLAPRVRHGGRLSVAGVERSFSTMRPRHPNCAC